MPGMAWMGLSNPRVDAAADKTVDLGYKHRRRPTLPLPLGQVKVMSVDIVEEPTDTTQREVPSGRKLAGTDVAPLKDPVCGMSVTSRSPHMALYEATAVYFCSAGCKSKFLANPAKYSIAPGSIHEPPA